MGKESVDELWKQAEELSNKTTLMYKDEAEIGVERSWYHEWGEGTMSLSFTERYGTVAVEPFAFPVSSVTSTGKTVREHAIGTSTVVTVLMRNGQESGRNQDSSTLSKTASATVNIYPGSVPSGTEFRAHGTHTINKGLNHTVGYTGDSLRF